MTWQKGDSSEIRQMIFHENDLINHRLTWLLVLNGLLFAAISFNNTFANQLVKPLAIIGIVSSLLAFYVILCAHLTIKSLYKGWEKNKPVDYQGPDVIGRSGNRFEVLLYPWFILPFLLIGVWIYFLCIKTAQPC